MTTPHTTADAMLVPLTTDAEIDAARAMMAAMWDAIRPLLKATEAALRAPKTDTWHADYAAALAAQHAAEAPYEALAHRVSEVQIARRAAHSRAALRAYDRSAR